MKKLILGFILLTLSTTAFSLNYNAVAINQYAPRAVSACHEAERIKYKGKPGNLQGKLNLCKLYLNKTSYYARRLYNTKDGYRMERIVKYDVPNALRYANQGEPTGARRNAERAWGEVVAWKKKN